MHLKRARFLADWFSKNVKQEEFDIRSWERHCGTVRCLGGWTCHIPEFNLLGLTPDWAGKPTYCYRGKQEVGGTALRLFLGLTLKEGGVFYFSGYKNEPTKAAVLRKLRGYIRKHERQRKSNATS